VAVFKQAVKKKWAWCGRDLSINKRHVRIDWANIIAWYSKYLTKMKKLRAEGRQTFYLDESWIDTY
jgi:hypothetical protein